MIDIWGGSTRIILQLRQVILWMMGLLFSLSLCLHIDNVTEKRVSFEEANRICSIIGPSFKLVDPTIEQVNNKFDRAIANREVPSAWLPFKFQRFRDFLWLDNTTADPRISSIGHQLGYSCGALDILNEYYDFRPCHQTGLSFLCEKKDCEACHTIGKTFHECLVLEDSCFSFHCGSANWYNAREACKREGSELAVLKRRSLLIKFNRFWKSTYGGPCGTAWIGLRRESWITDEAAEPRLSLWAQEEPSENGNCSIIYTYGGYIVWRTVSCAEEHLFFCSEKEVTSLPTELTTKYMQKESKNLTSPEENSEINLQTEECWIILIGLIGTCMACIIVVLEWKRIARQVQQCTPVDTSNGRNLPLTKRNKSDQNVEDSIPPNGQTSDSPSSEEPETKQLISQGDDSEVGLIDGHMYDRGATGKTTDDTVQEKNQEYRAKLLDQNKQGIESSSPCTGKSPQNDQTSDYTSSKQPEKQESDDQCQATIESVIDGNRHCTDKETAWFC